MPALMIPACCISIPSPTMIMIIKTVMLIITIVILMLIVIRLIMCNIVQSNKVALNAGKYD